MVKHLLNYSEDDDETIYYGYTVSVPSENTRYYYRASSTASVWGKSAYIKTQELNL